MKTKNKNKLDIDQISNEIIEFFHLIKSKTKIILTISFFLLCFLIPFILFEFFPHISNSINSTLLHFFEIYNKELKIVILFSSVIIPFSIHIIIRRNHNKSVRSSPVKIEKKIIEEYQKELDSSNLNPLNQENYG